MQFSSNFVAENAYEALYLKEVEKNAILLSRISEKEALISQLHAANAEAYAKIHDLELQLREILVNRDQLSRDSLQQSAELAGLKKKLVFSQVSKESEISSRNCSENEHKKLKYMTLGNENLLFFENEVERLRHQLQVFEKFHESLAKAVVDCSPPNTYKLRPTLKEIWKWVRNLIEEYMVLKTRGRV